MENVYLSNGIVWILLWPLIGAAINGIIGHKLPRKLVTFIALAAPFASMAQAGYLFTHLLHDDLPLYQAVFNWISVDGTSIWFSLMLDQLSGVMALTVTFVGFLIHVYSVGYMSHDPAYSRYFAYLNLFMFAMLTLVLANNLVVMFIGWEGVGLCSYLLIGFWYQDEDKAKAGKKAFIVNRIGDFGFLIAIFIFFYFVGAIDYTTLKQFFAGGVPPIMGMTIATIAGLALFLGATGKSAQIPLYVWLPDAMAGPTPVSALIHAATMVTAGVYMVARLNFFFVHIPVSMGTIAIVGGLTALFAATMGFFQNDIKKVLAYSTVSQLGFMFMAAGVGAWAVAIFHVFTHAFFKACLFLGSGSVIHAHDGIQDIRQMGGLKKLMPKTYWSFAIATFTIAGFPPAAAFFSKDEILWRVLNTHNDVFPALPFVVYALGLLAAFGTAFYMYRMFYLAFSGESRAPAEVQKHIHEAPPVMSWVLVILAGLSLVVGFLGLPHVFGPNLFENFLFNGALSAKVEAHGPVWLELSLMVLSVGVALGGWYLARVLYKDAKSTTPARLAEKYAGIHRVIANKYYVDEGYFYVVIRPLWNFSTFLWQFFDQWIIDGVIVNGGSRLLAFTSLHLRRMQTGNVHSYMAALVIGSAIIVFLYFG